MAKNTPKAPAAPADATKPGAPAPTTDTTEAKNADQSNGSVANPPATEGTATQPPADGSAKPTETPPEVTAAAQLSDPNKVEQPKANELLPPRPKRIKLVTPYGFYDDDEQLHMWQAGHETDDPDEIELLVSRGAEHTALE